MIESNQLYMLRDKVIRNQYLIIDSQILINHLFYNGNNNNNNTRDFFKNDELFYKSFFKNYNKYLLNFNTTNFNEKIINLIINSNNLAALKILIQDFKFQPSNEHLNNSIRNGKLKYIKYFLENGIFNSEIIIQEFKQVSREPNTFIKFIKTLNYLFNEKIIGFNNNHGTKDCIDKFKSKLSNYLSIKETTTLKVLISLIKFIINSSNNNKVLCKVDLNQFTKEELKLEITNTLICINHKESLKSMIEFYYKLSNQVVVPETDLFYHLYLCGDDDFVLNKSNIAISKDHYKYFSKLSFQCASFKLFNQLLQFKKSPEIYETISDLSHHNLFSYCMENKEKQIQFINCISSSSFISNSLIYLLISYGDLELIKIYEAAAATQFKLNNSFYPLYIDSNKVLEYYFNDYHNEYSNILKANIFSFQNIQLLYKFEQLFKNRFKNENIDIKESLESLIVKYQYSIIETAIPPKSVIEILIHVLSNSSSLYKIETSSKILYQIIETLHSNLTNQDILELCKLIFLNYHIKDRFMFNFEKNQYTSFFEKLMNSIGFSKFIDWLYINYNEDLYQLFSCVPFVLFRTGRYESISKKDDHLSSELLSYSIFKYQINNIKFVEYCLNRLVSLTPQQFIGQRGLILIHSILEQCIRDSNLKTLEYIMINHNWVFTTKTKKSSSSSSSNINNNNNNNISIINNNNNGYSLDLKHLKRLLHISLLYGYLELAEILFQMIPVTQKDFSTCSNELSKSYFKNKSFK